MANQSEEATTTGLALLLPPRYTLPMTASLSDFRVLHIITGVDFGGAETMMIKLLSRRGHADAWVVSLLGSGGLSGAIRDTGAELIELDMPRKRLTPGGLKTLLSTARRARPDVIQGWMYHGNLAATAARFACHNRPSVVWSIHNTFKDPGRPRPITRLSKRLSKSPDRTVYVSRKSAEQHGALGFAGQPRIIPIGFDTDAYRPDPQARAAFRSELGVPSRALLLGLLGRFAPMKGFDILGRAAPGLLEKFPDLQLVLAGPGVDPSAMGPMYPSSDRVHILGPRADVPRVLAGLDLLVLPSKYGESFPNILGEGMACALPCVASELGETPLMVGDAGRLVPAGDEEAFVRAVGSLLALPGAERVELGRRARARIIERFGLDSMASRFAALYEELQVCS